jgi:hypothetical protein
LYNISEDRGVDFTALTASRRRRRRRKALKEWRGEKKASGLSMPDQPP